MIILIILSESSSISRHLRNSLNLIFQQQVEEEEDDDDGHCLFSVSSDKYISITL